MIDYSQNLTEWCNPAMLPSLSGSHWNFSTWSPQSVSVCVKCVEHDVIRKHSSGANYMVPYFVLNEMQKSSQAQFIFISHSFYCCCHWFFELYLNHSPNVVFASLAHTLSESFSVACSMFTTHHNGFSAGVESFCHCMHCCGFVHIFVFLYFIYLRHLWFGLCAFEIYLFVS